METLINTISNLGFPIAMCVILLIQNQKTIDIVNRNTEVVNELKTFMTTILETLKASKEDDK